MGGDFAPDPDLPLSVLSGIAREGGGRDPSRSLSSKANFHELTGGTAAPDSYFSRQLTGNRTRMGYRDPSGPADLARISVN